MDVIFISGSRLELRLTPDDNRLTATLVHLESGRRWGPVPTLALEVYDRPLKRVERVETWRLEHKEAVANGYRIIVCDDEHGIEVGLWLRLIDDELSVQFAPIECYERDSELYRLFALDVLPGLANVTAGRLLLPLNTGMCCPTHGAPAVRDRFLIYGEQERWELTPSLPICAAADANEGLMMLVTQGACDAECRVSTDGQDAGNVGFAFSLRRTWVDPVDLAARELRVATCLDASKMVRACAQRLRKHVTDDLGKRTLIARAKESPEVAYLLDCYIMKLFHAVENVGYMMRGHKPLNPGSYQRYMTFSEASDCLSKLKQAGVDRILTQCTGWNARGHDGLYPTRFPIDERIGGEQGFRDMIRHGNSLGYHVQVHDNFIMQNLSSPDFNRDYTTIDIHGEPLIHGRWAGGPEASGWPLAMPAERIGGHMKRLKDMGLEGMFYVDYMEQPLEVNYHPNHGGGRADCARGQALIISEARRVFGACGTEFGFLPCAIEADHISTCGEPHHLSWCKAEWPISSLIAPERVVPLWQMTMSGLVVLEARHGVSWNNAMRCVLLGCAPRDEWAVRPGVMPVLDDARIEAQKAIFDLCVVEFGHLKKHALIDHQIDDGAHRSEFDDGSTVEADFTTGELRVNGRHVAKPPALT